MTLASTYSWVFYALALASQKAPANHREIERVADGINHALPTQKELSESIKWLISEGLIINYTRNYELSETGTELISTLSANTRTTLGIWKKIESNFEKRGVDNAEHINPNTLNA